MLNLGQRGRRAERDSPRSPSCQRSPGFAQIAGYLSAQRKFTLLDLGTPSAGTFEFYSSLRCKLYVEGLRSVLDTLNGKLDGDEVVFPEYTEVLQTYDESVRFDIVLAWDLFNYLSPGALERLALYLRPHCKRSTQVFGLINTAPDQPQVPLSFSIDGPDSLLYDPDQQPRRPCPRYGQRQLEEYLPCLSVDHTYLLQNRMQEYVFRCWT